MIRLFNDEVKKQISDEITEALLEDMVGRSFANEKVYSEWADMIIRVYGNRLTENDLYYILDVGADLIKELW